MKKKGISLVALIILIIIVIIISVTVIISILNEGVFGLSKKARFMKDFRTVEQGVNLYSMSNYNYQTNEFELPAKDYLTEDEKLYIREYNSTLKEKIVELSGPLESLDLAWISHNDLNIKLFKEKENTGYIIDINKRQLYDYNGEYFEGKMWHTLDGGIISDGIKPVETDEIWDGWIKITLYYPSNSTEKQWRLGNEGELRVDPMLMWQSYTGPITVPLDRLSDVWIKYKIDGREVTIPPAGTLLVDIVPDKTGTIKVDKVNVSITYDETAITKEYRVGDSGWITYNGSFQVTENCIIEARAKKIEYIYDTEGNLLVSRNLAGKDLVYIGNIGIEEEGDTSILPAPVINRLQGIGDEKARIKITYPEEAIRKIYKINFGVEDIYTEEIAVNNYGTYIIAYYYDINGKKSKVSSIRINEPTETEPHEPPKQYIPRGPYVPGETIIPEITIPSPTININPTTLTDQVQVSVSAPSDAQSVYIKLGRYSSYKEYTGPITVKSNMEIYAYYRTSQGEKSDTAFKIVNNIKKGSKPYVYINPDPYPWTGAPRVSEVTVTVQHSNANKIEYSEDDILYKAYVGPFKVTKNKMIYARGTNANGVTETEIYISNIGEIKPPVQRHKLQVKINVEPDPLVNQEKVEKVKLSIDYDSRATEKYYSIGKYGELKTYTGEFEINTNCTIYAYAKGILAEGKSSKIIDNISSGISEPVINAIPQNGTNASKVLIGITYDKSATIKKYSIDESALIDYNGEFEITTNNTTIHAFSENFLGQTSETMYTVKNIITEQPSLLLDKGEYYLLKLNFPPEAQDKQYKWKEFGVWKQYNDVGILLIKPEYKDNLLKNGNLIKIEDDTGKLITYTGDYYFIDVSISEISENMFLRWDRIPLGAPQIILNTKEPALKVTSTILYNSGLIKRQYKIEGPGETSDKWLDYKGPITIDRNNTLIYARGMDDGEMWTTESVLKVTNIDEVQPIIKIIANLDSMQQQVTTKVTVTDDIGVGRVKWATGIYGESYFANSGIEILNNSTVNITENGYYTFYAEDKVGNKQVYTLNVTNIDKEPPTTPLMSVSHTTWTNTDVTITITYSGDSVVKEYSLDSKTWQKYTKPVMVSNNNTTVYARSQDEAGNLSNSSSITIANIDKFAPTVSFGKDGSASSNEAETTINVNEVGTSGLELNSLQYVWDIQNITAPTSGWTAFTNGDIITKNTDNGRYYLWVKASDKAGNMVTTKSNAFILDTNPPIIVLGTNGGTNIKKASTKITVTDAGGSELNLSSLLFRWDTQDAIPPLNGWTVFVSGSNITKDSVTDTYYLWVKASDNAGNTTIIKSLPFDIDNTIPENPGMSVTPTTWTDGDVTVTIGYPEDSTIREYSTNGTTWNTYVSSIIVTNNCTVYARCSDASGNYSGQTTLTITNIDKQLPEDPIITWDTSTGQMKGIVTLVDNLSGPDITRSKYFTSTSNVPVSTTAAEWTNGTAKVFTSNPYQSNDIIASEDSLIYLHVLTVDKTGNVKVSVLDLSYTIPSESLFGFIQDNDLPDGNYKVVINEITYKIELKNILSDITYMENTVLGDSSIDKKTLIVKYHGNMTVNSNVNVTANTVGGLTYKKGMIIYVAGTLTNNGTITMTARGTVNQIGENIYLWKNTNSTYEYVPAVGGAGGLLISRRASIGSTQVGNNGGAGAARSTGGGGTGGVVSNSNTTVAAAGAAGTSYSGGSASGGAYNGATSIEGSANGGPGGAGVGKAVYTWSCGGGAGNPGGAGANGGSVGVTGTGGLLVIYAQNFANFGTISSNGSAGGKSYRTGGGGSGGGSVNIFYENITSTGTITVTGGAGGLGTRSGESARGGTGGAGRVTKGSIATGIFVLQ